MVVAGVEISQENFPNNNLMLQGYTKHFTLRGQRQAVCMNVKQSELSFLR